MAGGLIEAVWLEMFRLGSTAGNRQHSSLAGAGMSKKKKKKVFLSKNWTAAGLAPGEVPGVFQLALDQTCTDRRHCSSFCDLSHV